MSSSTVTTPQYEYQASKPDRSRDLSSWVEIIFVAILGGILTPLIYLADIKNSDYLEILDYVPYLCYELKEQVLSPQDGSEIVLKTGPQKPSLEKCNPDAEHSSQLWDSSQIIIRG